MKKIQSLLLIGLLCSVQQVRSILTPIDLVAVWLICSYLSKVSQSFSNSQQLAKQQAALEALRKISGLLQSNQIDLQYCKKHEQELSMQIAFLAQKIYNQEQKQFLKL